MRGCGELQVLQQAAQGLAQARRLTVAEEKKLLWPLLRLRQACCHPQVSLTSPPLVCVPPLCPYSSPGILSHGSRGTPLLLVKLVVNPGRAVYLHLPQTPLLRLILAILS